MLLGSVHTFFGGEERSSFNGDSGRKPISINYLATIHSLLSKYELHSFFKYKPAKMTTSTSWGYNTVNVGEVQKSICLYNFLKGPK